MGQDRLTRFDKWVTKYQPDPPRGGLAGETGWRAITRKMKKKKQRRDEMPTKEKETETETRCLPDKDEITYQKEMPNRD